MNKISETTTNSHHHHQHSYIFVKFKAIFISRLLSFFFFFTIFNSLTHIFICISIYVRVQSFLCCWIFFFCIWFHRWVYLLTTIDNIDIFIFNFVREWNWKREKKWNFALCTYIDNKRKQKEKKRTKKITIKGKRVGPMICAHKR